LKHTTTKGKNNKESKMTNSNNTKGFTLIELIMVTIILGILAAVAIPRYMTSITKAEEAAEDAVISSIKAGLQTYATEKLMDNGRPSWPGDPFRGLQAKPAGHQTSHAADVSADGQWAFYVTTPPTTTNDTTGVVQHMRNDGTVVHWDYDQNNSTNTGTSNGSNTDAIGTFGARQSLVGH
jgi:prepilin-type N-terminal cleavage/methylation domain-containing protein